MLGSFASNEKKREVVRLYREGCDLLETASSNLKRNSAARGLVAEKRDEYRRRARELSNSLLPEALPVSGGSSRSILPPMADAALDEYGSLQSLPEVDDSFVAGLPPAPNSQPGVSPRAITQPNPPPVAPSAPPLSPPPPDFWSDSTSPEGGAALRSIGPNNTTNIVDDDNLTTAQKIERANSLLNDAIIIDEGANFDAENLTKIYLRTAELYLSAIRECKNRQVTKQLKGKLDMILARVEDLKKTDRSATKVVRQELLRQKEVHSMKKGTPFWLCGACA